MGFFADRMFSTRVPIIKGVVSRWEVKHLINLIHFLENLVHTKIPNEVKEQHNITNAEKLYVDFEKQFHEATVEEHHIFRNVDLDQEYLVKKEQKFITFFEKHLKEMERREPIKHLKERLIALEKTFRRKMHQVYTIARNESREEYTRVMQLVESAHDKGAFMHKLQELGHSGEAGWTQYWMAKTEIAEEIRKAEKAKAHMKDFEQKVKTLETEIKANKPAKDIEKLIQELEKHINDIAGETEDSFKADFKVVMRCFLMTFLVLEYLHTFENEAIEYIKQKDMPQASNPQQAVQDLQKGMAEVLHYQAQALRVITKEEEYVMNQT